MQNDWTQVLTIYIFDIPGHSAASSFENIKLVFAVHEQENNNFIIWQATSSHAWTS